MRLCKNKTAEILQFPITVIFHSLRGMLNQGNTVDPTLMPTGNEAGSKECMVMWAVDWDMQQGTQSISLGWNWWC